MSAQQQVAQQARARGPCLSRTAAAATARLSRAWVADRARARRRNGPSRRRPDRRKTSGTGLTSARSPNTGGRPRRCQAAGGSGSGGAPSRRPVAAVADPGGGHLGRVGWRVHPAYSGYRSCHTGVAHRGTTGTQIRAAARAGASVCTPSSTTGGRTSATHVRAVSRARPSVRGARGRWGRLFGTSGPGETHWPPPARFEVHVNRRAASMGWFGGGTRHPVPCYSGEPPPDVEVRGPSRRRLVVPAGGTRRACDGEHDPPRTAVTSGVPRYRPHRPVRPRRGLAPLAYQRRGDRLLRAPAHRAGPARLRARRPAAC